MSEANEYSSTKRPRNWWLLLGSILIGMGLFSSVFLVVLEAILTAAPYLGVLYLLFALAIVVGLGMLLVGVIQRRHVADPQRKGLIAKIRFTLDLAKRSHFYAIVSIFMAGMFVLALLSFGSYKSYRATESASFCGELCHSVMHPEWTTYQTSSHARVACVECHIGEGADWFVKSKIDGLRQVWAVTVNSFSRPIPTPIHNLRPARETCEECHWPQKFIGYRELVRAYTLSDEENTAHRLRMLLKIGGEQTGFMKGSGIHYHMLIAAKIEYIATDERRQNIPWVRVTRSDGSVTEFDSLDSPLSEAEKAGAEVRTMDCMDCHNRPSHQFMAPMSAVNMAIEQGAIPRTLPHIKVQAVRALSHEYKTTDQAMVGVANSLRNYYREEYPQFVENGSEDLTRAIQAVQAIYRGSIFPEMHASWSAYPDNIGHHYSPGCFRCHNESMQSAEGENIFTTCTKCHLILAQGESIDDVKVDFRTGLAFVHPEDGATIEEYVDCVDCHTGGGGVYE
ncbi:MAG: NapC/NirT family cytochrome c [Myxococcales bacterium]|nr:NapC/NirT family cytochrome c [Myxococcales bacterium]